MSSFLPHQQSRVSWLVLDMGERRPYSCCFVGCSFQAFFITACSILVQLPWRLFSTPFVSFHVVHPYSIIDTTAAPSHGRVSVRWLARTYLQQLREDIECSLKNLLTIETSGEGESWKSALEARHDDDDYITRFQYIYLSISSTVSWGCKKRQTASLRRNRIFLTECPRYDTKPSGSETTILELCRVWSTCSLPLVRVHILWLYLLDSHYMGHLELFKHQNLCEPLIGV